MHTAFYTELPGAVVLHYKPGNTAYRYYRVNMPVLPINLTVHRMLFKKKFKCMHDPKLILKAQEHAIKLLRHDPS